MRARGIFRRRGASQRPDNDVPADMLEKCGACQGLVLKRVLADELWVCPQCGYHMRLSAQRRIEVTVDQGSWQELYADLGSGDPLGFPEYAEKVREAEAKTGLREALLVGEARIEGCEVILGIVDAAFRAATMGHVVGEKVCLALERAAEARRPAVLFCASGGARVNEGLIALMQMAKTSGAVGRINEAGLPYITVLTNPTYAGVMASFASLGDIVLAEPGASLGFTGPRVIELSLKRKGPFRWQTAEFMHEHGLIDLIVPRNEMARTLGRLLALCTGAAEPREAAAEDDAGAEGDEA